MKIPLWSFHVSIFITLTPIDSTRLTKITKSSANSFLRQKRANKGFFSEIFKTADLQRECQDNTCSTEEFNSQFFQNFEKTSISKNFKIEKLVS